MLYSSISRQATGILFNQRANSHFWEAHTSAYAKIATRINKKMSFLPKVVGNPEMGY
jgi:hypothetical protein